MSDDAVRASNSASNAAWGDAWFAAKGDAWDAAYDAARDAAMGDARDAAWNAVGDAAKGDAWDAALDAALGAAPRAAEVEVVSDLISPENYRILTNPLAAGRAVDVLAPRYKDTPFREMLQELAPRSAITQPSDVLGVGRIARSPEEIREIAMTLIADGMTVEEALNAARLLA
jgi:hypothetical protein